MSSSDILLVTFPVDLGNKTLESNLQKIFSDDATCFRFAGQLVDSKNCGKVSLHKIISYKVGSAFELRKVVRKYTNEDKFILFHGISPALFSYGIWNPRRTAIALDWTRNLYPSILGEPLKKNWVFNLHQKVLRNCQKVLCWTDAVMENLLDVYDLEPATLFRVPMPFQIEELSISPRPTPPKPKVLFVGGDLKRKGGDVLLQYWQQNLREQCELTMMTNDLSANVEGVNFLPDIKYGSPIHRRTFEEHDILVLPTRIDGYPQVVGEAAAAGLAVITTKFALGAKDVISDGRSGYISNSPEECMIQLQDLLGTPPSIDSFKTEGFNLMQEKFSRAIIREEHLKILMQ